MKKASFIKKLLKFVTLKSWKTKPRPNKKFVSNFISKLSGDFQDPGSRKT